MNFIQIILLIFIIFALSRVILRFKGGNVSLFGLIFWVLIFSSAIIFVIFPNISGKIANSLGIGRGVDAIIYTSIVILFYLVFRIYVNLENIKHQITDIVSKMALEKYENEKSKVKNPKD